MAGLFATAPKEVVDYFDRRGSKPSWRWSDVAPHEHALAFTVARTEGYDVIDTLRQAVRQAVVERVPYEKFRDELIPKLQAKQWWGNVIRDGKKVELGSLRRLQTIYWANIRSAHAAGEWARTQETKDFLPYLTYKRTLSATARPEHLAWVGTTLPVDHAWWRTHYPPNGWNCKCRVEQIGEVAAGRAPADKRVAPKLETALWRDKVTGRTQRVPKGIDPGWQSNPGMTRETRASTELSASLGALPFEARSAAIKAVRAAPDFRYLIANEVGYPAQRKGVVLTPEMAARGRLMTAVAALPDALAEQIDSADAVLLLSQADAAKQKHDHADVTAEHYEGLQDMLAGDLVMQMDRGKYRLIGSIGDHRWVSVVKVTSKGEVLLNSFRRARPGQYGEPK